MALASFTLIQTNGAAPGTESNCNKHPSFCGADVQTETPGSYQIPAPLDVSESPTHSYEVDLKLRCAVAPDNECSNFRYYGPSTQPDSDSVPPNKLTVMAGVRDTYAQPVNTASSVATVSQHDHYYSPGTGLALPAATVDDVIDAVGEETEHLVLQLAVALGAQQGNIKTYTGLWSYDES